VIEHRCTGITLSSYKQKDPNNAYLTDGRQSCFLLRTLDKVKLPLVPSGTPFAKPGLRFETYEGMDHSLNEQVSGDLLILDRRYCHVGKVKY
jgi:hypothetical protein